MAQNFSETDGVAAGLLHDAAEHHIGQKAGVFGKQAEDNPVQEVCDGGGVKAALAQGVGDFGEVLGGVLGNSGTRAAGAEGLGVVEDRPHNFDVAGFVQGFKRDVVGGGNGAGEVGMNDDPVEVAYYQQGRTFQGVAVA
ncbi:MAG: hypothetical protein NTV49_05270 [Kiritimatiellaeota bacterium]|nr:hypothetical protein [Kiritimatiellota bacterium]